MTILELWNQCLNPPPEWTVAHPRVSPFLFDLRLPICRQFLQALTRNSGWIVIHPRVSPVLVECLVPSRPNKIHFLDLLGELLFTPRVSPFSIIGLLFLVGFVWCPCCFQRLLNPILSSGYSWKKSLDMVHVTQKTFSFWCFSRFHRNNFRDTISWECIVKDDCVIQTKQVEKTPRNNVLGRFSACST